MWVSYLRDQYLHLVNTTNNRLECHHHKLKDLTSRSSTLSEMFDHVLTFSFTHALEYSQRSFVEEFTTRTTAFDHVPYAGEIAAVCTEHAANLVCEQLELAGKVNYQFKQHPYKEYMFELAYKDHKHFVDIDSNSCSCSFSKTLGLPCRHVFAARKKLDHVIFCTSMVGDRWLKSYQIQVPGSKDLLQSALPDDVSSVPQSDQFHLNISNLQKKPLKATLSQNQKYKKALEIGQKIAGVASQVGMPNFREMFSVLEQLLGYWENNVSVVVTPKEDGSSLEHRTALGDNESLPVLQPCTVTKGSVLGDSLLDMDSEVKLPNDSAAPKDAIQDMHDSESFPSD